MRCKTLALCAFLLLPGAAVADTLDDLVSASLAGDEQRTESATAAAISDKSFPFARGAAKAVELATGFEAADKKRQESLTRAIKAVLSVTVERAGEKEVALIVPKLIEGVNKGGTQCNLIIETSLSILTNHGFVDADYKAQSTAIDNWDDHKKMWTTWWGSNSAKPYMALVMGGFERAGVKIVPGKGEDSDLEGMVNVMVDALTHNQVYIRANAAKVLRSGMFRGLKSPWGFDPEAPQATRQKSVEEARKLFAENKQAVFDNMRGKGP